jgi:hypothetical protein
MGFPPGDWLKGWGLFCSDRTGGAQARQFDGRAALRATTDICPEPTRGILDCNIKWL